MAWSDRQKEMSVNQKVVVCNKCGLGYLSNCRLPISNFFCWCDLVLNKQKKICFQFTEGRCVSLANKDQNLVLSSGGAYDVS